MTSRAASPPTIDYAALAEGIDDETIAAPPPPPSWRPPPADDVPPPPGVLEEVRGSLASEFVVEKNGTVRQAGASQADTSRVALIKQTAERSLFFFAKAILGRTYLTTALHQPVCTWLQDFSTHRRKGLLLPREHAKSSIVSHALPLHILIQPKEANVYFAGEAGCEQRVILACVTADLAKKHLGTQREILERNALVRAFWPQVAWEKPSRDAKRWNNVEFDVPRDGTFPDPSVRAIGVDGAVTGSHPSVVIEDDLIEREAANSAVVMESAINWHVASSSLTNRANTLRFVVGTRWAVHDLYSYIQEHDPLVDWYIRAAVEDGVPIYPEGGFSAGKIAELQKEQGPLFLLLYMNSAADPSLTDFDLSLLRHYEMTADGRLSILDDARDLLLRQQADPTARAIRAASLSREYVGRPLNAVLADLASARERRRTSHLAATPFAASRLVTT